MAPNLGVGEIPIASDPFAFQLAEVLASYGGSVPSQSSLVLIRPQKPPVDLHELMRSRLAENESIARDALLLLRNKTRESPQASDLVHPDSVAAVEARREEYVDDAFQSFDTVP
eukprot:CAMPEP_0184664218 /NCGR_PEP_ID=MMETSP0308-20130426/51786_1 /TAXON_ID=38269 /ORGANISM="Gloeochaete witrockiana, Strain SAG 46.84" /LENGTH=113 /DNA_ID=CAMNT_0027107463 /DNA_START=84 /DNA_END=426 /DNA_ORIENTATION=-